MSPISRITFGSQQRDSLQLSAAPFVLIVGETNTSAEAAPTVVKRADNIETTTTMPTTVLGTPITEGKLLAPLVPGNGVVRAAAQAWPVDDDKHNANFGPWWGKDQRWGNVRQRRL